MRHETSSAPGGPCSESRSGSASRGVSSCSRMSGWRWRRSARRSTPSGSFTRMGRRSRGSGWSTNARWKNDERGTDKMSVWSIALDRQVDLWRKCSPYSSFDELRREAWVLSNLDGEVVTPDEIIGEESMQALFHRLLTLSPQHVPLYYFSPETCQMLRQAASSYPVDMTPPPDSCFLSELGFWYFTEPFTASTPLDAFERPLRMLLWHRSSTHKLLTFVGLLDEAHAPLPLFFGSWPASYTIQQAIDNFDTNTVQDDEGKFEKTQAMLRIAMQYIGATISFCHQRVFIDRREPADRAARRRAQAQGIEVPSDVHVMMLRRAVPHETEGTREVDWSWRWWVRGHWRQQAVGPGRQDRVPVFIASYIKGPEDRPMKPGGPSVYVVTR